jgi:hypothetical protein
VVSRFIARRRVLNTDLSTLDVQFPSP